MAYFNSRESTRRSIGTKTFELNDRLARISSSSRSDFRRALSSIFFFYVCILPSVRIGVHVVFNFMKEKCGGADGDGDV